VRLFHRFLPKTIDSLTPIKNEQNQFETDDSLPDRLDAVVCASGSGGTHAGITAGFYQTDTDVVGISTRHPEEKQRNHIHALAEKTYQHILGDDAATIPKEEVVVKDAYVGPGYSLPTKAMEEAVTLFARQEAILLDPVYTGKAAAGLIDLIRQGYFPNGSNVVFLHTGGAPSLYHYMPMDDQVPGVAGAGKTQVVIPSAEEKKSD